MSSNQENRPTELCVLKGARELISDPRHWTQNEFARDLLGEVVGTHNPQAVCWCSLGAIYKAARTCGVSEVRAELALEAAIEDEVTSFNDSHTHAEVLAAFDKAILAASSEHQSQAGATEGR